MFLKTSPLHFWTLFSCSCHPLEYYSWARSFSPFLLLNSITGKWSSSQFKLGSFSLFTLHALLGHYFNSSGFKLHPYVCHPHTHFHFRPLFWATDTYIQLLPWDPYLVVHGCLEKISQGQISTLNHPSQMPTLNLFYPWVMHFSKCQLHEIICTNQKSRSHQHSYFSIPYHPYWVHQKNHLINFPKHMFPNGLQHTPAKLQPYFKSLPSPTWSTVISFVYF